jgi:hypothetical protein
MKKLLLILFIFFIGLGSYNALTDALSLTSITISGTTVEPMFKSSITFYRARVKNNITNVSVNATLKDKNSTIVSGIGNKQAIAVGNNRFEITVKDVNKNVFTYVLIVSREDTSGNIPSDTYSGMLKELTIDEYALYFKPVEFKYDLEVPNSITKLTMNAKAQESNLQVETIGNENFKVGNNVVTINVKNGASIIRTYTLNINRKDVAEVSKEKNIYYIVKNSDENPIKIQLEVPQVMMQTTLDYILTANKNVVFEYLNTDKKVTHSLEVYYDKIVNSSMDINLEADLVTNYKYQNKDALLLDLKQTTFPGTVKVNINTTDYYKNNQIIELYKKKDNTFTKLAEVTVKDDKVSFNTTKGGEYVTVLKDEKVVKQQEQTKKILIIGGLSLLDLIALIQVIKVIRRK